MRLYVGGLPYSTTEQDLISLFEQAGAVANATVIIDRETGRSKGFGFVEMTTDEDGQSATSRLRGSRFLLHIGWHFWFLVVINRLRRNCLPRNAN